MINYLQNEDLCSIGVAIAEHLAKDEAIYDFCQLIPVYKLPIPLPKMFQYGNSTADGKFRFSLYVQITITSVGVKYQWYSVPVILME